MTRDELRRALVEHAYLEGDFALREHAYLEGDFVLRSGKRSTYYLDKYRFETRPDLLAPLGDLIAAEVTERAQQVRTRLEPVLVEVVRRALSGAEDEVALEVRVLDERPAELVVPHARAVRRNSRASGSSRCASAEPSESETIEPSPK